MPAHILHDIVRKLPDGAEVSLDTGDGAQLALKSGRSRFTLQVLPEADFPDLTTGEFPIRFTLPASAVKKLIDRTQFAISTEETRYYLNGIYLHVRHASTARRCCARSPPTATAWRSRRWRRRRASAGMAGVIVPRKAVGEIQKLVEDPEASVEIEVSDTKIRVTIGDVVLTSKLIDGTFPDYARVIPQANDKVLKVDRDEFAEAVDRVSTISSERGRAVKLALSDGKMVLSVNNPDSGSAVEELGVDYGADDLEIGFNARYLLDVAERLETEARRVPLRRSRLADPHPRRRRRRRALRADADAGVGASGAGNAKGRPSGRPFHCQPRGRGLTKLSPNSGGEDLAGGEVPGQLHRTRRKTMRHWITSFRLLTGAPNMDCVVVQCKIER